ncbi:hypothetical protein [Bradyrhizobium sp. BRP23]|uniref:hypothetical protein n=1 Tax=Bradyrhizobium sp. BRP23 TaxID=2793820 RepID=UPI001CD65E3E|nr:hypothetical protein [Bradyrhizobium sp. BRP23]MCA1419461.1 hypothetical protein [Bradyrhizobium sp. BRP23]
MIKLAAVAIVVAAAATAAMVPVHRAVPARTISVAALTAAAGNLPTSEFQDRSVIFLTER